MATKVLTDKSVSAAKAQPGQRLELWDAKTPGLCLRVSDNSKTWVYRYRTLEGRQPRFTLGAYSAKQGLAWARAEVDELRPIIRKGGDPAAERRQRAATAKARTIRTFNDLADAYMDACERGHWKPKGKRHRDSTLAKVRGSLKRHVRPAIGKMRLEDIDRRTVKGVLQEIADAGKGAEANKAHAAIRQAFAWAIAEHEGRLVSVNPATGFLAVAEQKPRARVLTDAELRAFWRGVLRPETLRLPLEEGREGEGEGVHVGRPMQIALQLTALLLQRRQEITGMRADELNLEQGTWLIDGARMKSGEPHLVPLPPRAVALVREALKLAQVRYGKQRPIFVFPAHRGLDAPMRPDSLSHAMRHVILALGFPPAGPHDLRRTGSTALTSERLGVSPFIRSQVLGHRTDTGGGASVSSAHYDANSYIAEKRAALAKWERLLTEIVGEGLRVVA